MWVRVSYWSSLGLTKFFFAKRQTLFCGIKRVGSIYRVHWTGWYRLLCVSLKISMYSIELCVQIAACMYIFKGICAQFAACISLKNLCVQTTLCIFEISLCSEFRIYLQCSDCCMCLHLSRLLFAYL